MIKISGQPTFDDYLKAQRFHGRSRAWTIGAILLGFAVIVLISNHSWVFPTCMVAYVFVLRPIFIHLRLKSHWRQTPSACGKEQSYDLDESGVHAEDDDGNPVVSHWDKFLKFKESKDSFLLYASPRLYLFFPKRFMNSDDQEATRRLLAEKLG